MVQILLHGVVVFWENVMFNGTERLGFQCVTPGPGVVNIPECFNPYWTVEVQCFQSEHVAKCWPWFGEFLFQSLSVSG